MMKKGIALLLIAALLCPMASGLAAVSARLKMSMATRSGPGTWYTEELGTLPASTAVTVIEQNPNSETTWALVEFRANGQLYRAYTGLWRMEVYGSVPLADTSSYDDTVLSDTTAYYGPGLEYAARRVRVPANTAVSVFAIENQWAFCEYKENGKRVRGYIAVTALQNTWGRQNPYTSPTATPYNWYGSSTPVVVTPPPSASSVTDYYGKPFNAVGYSQEFLTLVKKLPVMSYFDNVPCVQQAYVYSGPGENFWQPYVNTGYCFAGTSDTLRVYCQENDWLLIRYPTQTGYRYGWAPLSTIPSNLLYWAKEFEHAGVQVITTAETTATHDPDTRNSSGMAVSTGILMTALAFLDDSRQWVYCEYTVLDTGAYYSCRGFVPASALRALYE